MEKAEPKPGVYYGKPANQKNARAVNAHVPAGPSSSMRKVRVPATLPPPRSVTDTSHVKLTEVSPADSSVFGPGMSIREVVPRQTFSPSAPSIIEISRQSFGEILTDTPSLGKTILPEYVDYYSSALLWLRFIFLKQKNSQPLTDAEEELIQLTQTVSFCVPEPLALCYRSIGNVTSSTKQRLLPAFPPLPIDQINGFGGYYGTLASSPENHNLYEEIPCLGVTAEAVRQTVSDAPSGPYVSCLSVDGLSVNQNLLGYKPLAVRRAEAKALAQAAGITGTQFPCYPENTMFNIDFLLSISGILETSKTFKNTSLMMSTLSEIGAQSQTVVPIPIVQPNTVGLRGDQRVTSLCKETSSIYGSAVFFNQQLVKDPLNAQPLSWCCVTPTAAVPIPPVWVENRNMRRNLPLPYMTEVFTSVSTNACVHRMNVIKSLIISKRWSDMAK